MVVLPPRRITEAPPIYPDLAKAAGFEGNVILRVTVNADGSVGSVQVVRSPHRSLNAAAIEAVRQVHVLARRAAMACQRKPPQTSRSVSALKD